MIELVVFADVMIAGIAIMNKMVPASRKIISPKKIAQQVYRVCKWAVQKLFDLAIYLAFLPFRCLWWCWEKFSEEGNDSNGS